MSNCYETQLHFYITNHCIDVNICVPVYFVYEFNKINSFLRLVKLETKITTISFCVIFWTFCKDDSHIIFTQNYRAIYFVHFQFLHFTNTSVCLIHK